MDVKITQALTQIWVKNAKEGGSKLYKKVHEFLSLSLSHSLSLGLGPSTKLSTLNHKNKSAKSLPRLIFVCGRMSDVRWGVCLMLGEGC